MIEAWETLATRFAGDWNVVAADIANKPHTAGWATGDAALDFDAFAERLGNKIHAIAPHWLIVVEGVDGSPGCPSQSSPYDHWWGGYLECSGDYPPSSR